MKNPLRKLRPPAAIFLGFTLTVVLTTGVSSLFAQASSKRLVHVTVTDPLGRFVTGLEQGGFEIVEDGIRRPITEFSDAGSPISLAIVSDSPVAVGNLILPNDELIQTRSVTDAVRQLSSSKNTRKTLVITTAIDTPANLTGIQVIRASSGELTKTVVELKNQYLLQFDSANATAGVQVVLQQPRGLPTLRTNVR